ncbi:MAG: hypothetical protein JXA11_06015 [Phycisphaerae bacterium]|nr:hypothetical protein [Phycisphaerae bacterium]
MSLMRKLEDLVDRITTGEQMQYIMAGTLIVIIIISLLTVIMNLVGSGHKYEMVDQHFWCTETKQEFVMTPEEMREQMEKEGLEDGFIPDGPHMRYISKFTGNRTAVPMTRCPNCEKYFVPDYLLQEPYDDEEYYMMDNYGDLICPHCNTDVIQWYREHRKKRK